MNYCYIIIIFWQILIRTSYLLFTYSFNKNANFKSDVSSQVLSKGVLKSSRRNMLPKFWSDDQTSDFEDGEQKLKVFCLDQVYRGLFFFFNSKELIWVMSKKLFEKTKAFSYFFYLLHYFEMNIGLICLWFQNYNYEHWGLLLSSTATSCWVI